MKYLNYSYRVYYQHTLRVQCLLYSGFFYSKKLVLIIRIHNNTLNMKLHLTALHYTAINVPFVVLQCTALH